MKKTLFTILFAASVVMFVVTGCQKDETTAEQVTTKVIVREEPTAKAKEDGATYKETQKEATVEKKETPDTEVQNSETDRSVTTVSSVSDKSAKETVSNVTTTTTSTSQKNTTSSKKTEVHTHTWIAQTKTVPHAEEGHYETKVIQEAYDEEVYAWRTFCNKCFADITGNAVVHSVICCSGYYADYVVVDIIHHDAVTEQLWVVDKAAWTESFTTEYQCSCGALK